MAIPVDTYFIVTPGSEFISKAYGNLAGTDLFFYVTDTNSLRVVNMVSAGGTASPGSISYNLAVDAKWVGVISRPGVVHVYYADLNGQIWYITYQTFGGPANPVALTIGSVVTFSVTYTGQSIPQAYMMMTDDGLHHNLFAATDPMFQAQISNLQTYNNGLDHTFYVIRPSISMHPDDTNRITVHCQQIRISNDVNSVGFYVVRVPGLV